MIIIILCYYYYYYYYHHDYYYYSYSYSYSYSYYFYSYSNSFGRLMASDGLYTQCLPPPRHSLGARHLMRPPTCSKNLTPTAKT